VVTVTRASQPSAPSFTIDPATPQSSAVQVGTPRVEWAQSITVSASAPIVAGDVWEATVDGEPHSYTVNTAIDGFVGDLLTREAQFIA